MRLLVSCCAAGVLIVSSLNGILIGVASESLVNYWMDMEIGIFQETLAIMPHGAHISVSLLGSS